MDRWREGRPLKLKKHHRWHSKPGNTIFVSNGGAVRFEFPAKWIVRPNERGTICFYDRQPPDHHAILQLNSWELMTANGLLPSAPMPGVDWTTLPLLELFIESTKDLPDDRDLISKYPARDLIRPGLEAIWEDRLVFDKQDQKEVVSRTCMARGRNVTALLSYDYYADERARFQPVWEDVMGSLVLGQYVKDPTTGF